MTSLDLWALFLHEFVRLHGIPRVITSDRDPRLTSKEWQNICKDLGIRCGMTVAHRAQADGQVERSNAVVADQLRKTCADHGFNIDTHECWDDLLDQVEIQINNQHNDSTGETPYYLDLGFHPEFPGEALPVSFDLLESETMTTYVGRMRDISALAKQNLALGLKRMADSYKKSHRQLDRFHKHELVWVKTPLPLRNVKGTARPLEMRRHGPFPVLEARHPVYVIDFDQDPYKGEPVFNAEQLDRYTPDPNEEERPYFAMPAQHADKFEPAEVMQHRFLKDTKEGSRYEFLIRWKDWPSPSDYTWENYANFKQKAGPTRRWTHPVLQKYIDARPTLKAKTLV